MGEFGDPVVGCCVGEFLAEILIRVIVWVFLLPIALIVTTPFVLIGAAFRKDQCYEGAVRNSYRTILS